MKTLWICTLLTLATACGNPHISSVENGIERSNPPLAQEACKESEVEINDHRFFMDASVSEDYLAFVKCKRVVREDFNEHEDGTVPELSNSGHTEIPYVLTHRSQGKLDQDKVVTVEDIFGTLTYPFDVQNRAVYSGNTNDSFRDAFVWKFNAPVSFWSARPIGIKEHSTLRIFNCNEELLDETEITGRPQFIGAVSSSEEICFVSLTAADGSDSIAIDDFEYGN